MCAFFFSTTPMVKCKVFPPEKEFLKDFLKLPSVVSFLIVANYKILTLCN